jgi:hypothetical protein
MKEKLKQDNTLSSHIYSKSRETQNYKHTFFYLVKLKHLVTKALIWRIFFIKNK